MKRALFLVPLVAASLAWSHPRPAQACGGFFCNRPPPDGTLPIAQAAENVLFVLDRDPATGANRVEAHIQILYTGPASEFSWIVPVTSVPTVTIGSDILFDRIEPPTRPSFQVTYQMDGNCQSSGVGAGCGSASGAASSSKGFGGVVDAGTGGVDVLSRGSAGPFEYVVVRSEDGATLRTWLTTNNYFVSPEAAALVDEYVAGQFSFVALRLQVGQDTSAIRPIVLRMAANEGVPAPEADRDRGDAGSAHQRVGARERARGPDQLRRGRDQRDPARLVQLRCQLRSAPEGGGERGAGKRVRGRIRDAGDQLGRVVHGGGSWRALQFGERGGATDFRRGGSTIWGFQPTGAVLQLLRKHIPIPATLAARGVTEAMFYASISSYWQTDMAAFAPFDSVAAAGGLRHGHLHPDQYVPRPVSAERAPDQAGDVHLARGDDVRSAVRDEHVAARCAPATHGDRARDVRRQR
jgi:hypothetical protein